MTYTRNIYRYMLTLNMLNDGLALITALQSADFENNLVCLPFFLLSLFVGFNTATRTINTANLDHLKMDTQDVIKVT